MVQFTVPNMIPTGRTIPVSLALERVIPMIAARLQPEKIILFGSYAHGKPTPDSDVDLLIILNTELPLKERSWQVSQLLLPRPFPVDIIVKTPQEIEQALASNDYFIREIIDRGVVLYERGR